MPPSADRKLRIQFQKSLRKDYVKNAYMDPALPSVIEQAAQTNETFIVRIDSSKGGRYWFSDRRVLHEDNQGVREMLRYEAVKRVHWMFKGGLRNPMMSRGPSAKREYYDRLEIETHDGLIVLEGLDQAYLPTLQFLGWIQIEK